MRDIKMCHPRLQKLAEELLTACERKGYKIKITECLRTVAEQDALYAKGRTKPGNKVTNARGFSYSSMHQWGVAFDICRTDMKDAFYEADGLFKKVGAIGKALGLEWGGSWKSFPDVAHFQLPDWGSTPTLLKKKYATPEVFLNTWQITGTSEKNGKTTKTDNTKKNPAAVGNLEDVAMKTIQKGSKGKAVKIWQIILGVKADGIFGSGTEAKTIAFQKKHKLTDDGVVGNKTWKAGLESV